MPTLFRNQNTKITAAKTKQREKKDEFWWTEICFDKTYLWDRNNIHGIACATLSLPISSATFSGVNTHWIRSHKPIWICIHIHLNMQRELNEAKGIPFFFLSFWNHVDWISICLSWIWFDIFERSDRHFHESEYCFKLISIIKNEEYQCNVDTTSSS